MSGPGNGVLFGNQPQLATEVGELAGSYAILPHVIVALDQWSVTAAPWLSEPLEPVVLAVGLVGLWPLALSARHGEWFGALGSGLLAGATAIAFIPVLCNFAPAWKHPVRPGLKPLEGGCIPQRASPCTWRLR